MNVVVKPEIHEGAKIVIVGEAPGRDEVAAGELFVGKSGGVLQMCLNLAGIARSECIITNVIKERPDKNNISPYWDNKTGFTTKGQEWVDYLKDELTTYSNATVFVALGNVAMDALTGHVGITNLRGSLLPCTLVEGKKVISTIHPAASMRPGKFLERYYIVNDFKKAKIQSNTSKLEYVARRFILKPSYQVALAFLHNILEKKLRVTLDIETRRNLSVKLIGLGTSPQDVIVIPTGNNYWLVKEEVVLLRLIDKILGDEQIPITAHNAMFDLYVLLVEYGMVTKGTIDDTMIMFHLCYPDFPKALSFVSSIYTNEPYYKDMSTSDPLYNAKDVAVTAEIFPKIEEELQQKGLQDTYKMSTNLIPSMLYIQKRGIQVDVAELEKEKERVEKEIILKTDKLEDMCGIPLNPNSSQQCSQYFYGIKGYPPYTKKGRVTTDEKALLRLSRKGCKEADIVLDLRGLNKYRNTYLGIRLDEDDRLRGSYNIAGTKTGRRSSSQSLKGTGANMQNLDPKFKKFLIPDEGRILVNLDKKQAEWVIMAYLSGDPRMIQAVKDGDIHTATAKLMFGEPITKEKRYIGKRSNHGLNYNMGIQRFALELGISDKEAKTIHEAYHNIYPGVRQLHRRIEKRIQETQTLTNLLGRTRFFANRWGDGLLEEAYDYIPQSTVADNLTLALTTLYGKVDLLGETHDNILIQSYEDELAEDIYACLNALDIPMVCEGREFLVKTTVEIGRTWGSMVEIDVESGDSLATIKDKLCNVASLIG